MHLDKTHILEVSGNEFFENEAVEDDGGAVLYTCDPTTVEYNCTVALLGNLFVKNKALHKGGALRYQNTNFTNARLIMPPEEAEDDDESVEEGERRRRSL